MAGDFPGPELVRRCVLAGMAFDAAYDADMACMAAREAMASTGLDTSHIAAAEKLAHEARNLAWQASREAYLAAERGLSEVGVRLLKTILEPVLHRDKADVRAG